MEVEQEALVRFAAGKGSTKEVVQQLKVSRKALCSWKHKLPGEEPIAMSGSEMEGAKAARGSMAPGEALSAAEARREEVRRPA